MENNIEHIGFWDKEWTIDNSHPLKDNKDLVDDNEKLTTETILNFMEKFGKLTKDNSGFIYFNGETLWI